jgi:hypothetical protein
VRGNNLVPDIIDSRGIPHPRPYQINEYGAGNEQNPGDGAWYIARLERAGADGLRANWASAGNLHNDLGNLLVRNSAGQHQPKGEWWVYHYYASQTGQIVTSTPSQSYDPFATKANGVAKILVGGGGTTGNVAVALQRLDTTTGIVQNNQVRVLVQRIPHNNVDETFTITLQPPGGSGFQTVAAAQHSQQCWTTRISAARTATCSSSSTARVATNSCGTSPRCPAAPAPTPS